MHANDLDRFVYRKSSYSGGNGGACVEVALPADQPVAAVRDSKNSVGPVLTFTPEAFVAFRAAAQGGRFDLS